MPIPRPCCLAGLTLWAVDCLAQVSAASAASPVVPPPGASAAIASSAAAPAPTLWWHSLVGVVVGAVLGAGLTWGREVLKKRSGDRDDRNLLAARVAMSLELFGEECLPAACDDGLDDEGKLTDRGTRESNVSAYPRWDPAEMKVEWRTLEPALRYEVLSFSAVVRAAALETGAQVWDPYGDPDEETFARVRKRYCELGLQAYALAERLRRAGGLPAYRAVSEIDPREDLRERGAAASVEVLHWDELRAKRVARSDAI